MLYKSNVYSPITQSNTDILVPWIDNVNDKWYKTYGGYHTGIDIKGKFIYSYGSGVVKILNKNENNMYTVVIKHDNTNIFAYSHLSDVVLSIDEGIEDGTLIGMCDEFVHFEHSYAKGQDNRWPVRVDSTTYFKQNPSLVLDGQFKLYSNDWHRVLDIDEE